MGVLNMDHIMLKEKELSGGSPCNIVVMRKCFNSIVGFRRVQRGSAMKDQEIKISSMALRFDWFFLNLFDV